VLNVGRAFLFPHKNKGARRSERPKGKPELIRLRLRNYAATVTGQAADLQGGLRVTNGGSFRGPCKLP
jgi:hypothetical protein